jgi:hypothetical protein
MGLASSVNVFAPICRTRSHDAELLLPMKGDPGSSPG